MDDQTEVFYQMSEFYYPELARGVRWNDPTFGIVWPREIEVISERDRTYPGFEQLQCTC
jgi:dTDP-4-dehydrorhamnose 3,5-epimerase